MMKGGLRYRLKRRFVLSLQEEDTSRTPPSHRLMILSEWEIEQPCAGGRELKNLGPDVQGPLSRREYHFYVSSFTDHS